MYLEKTGPRRLLDRLIQCSKSRAAIHCELSAGIRECRKMCQWSRASPVFELQIIHIYFSYWHFETLRKRPFVGWNIPVCHPRFAQDVIDIAGSAAAFSHFHDNLLPIPSAHYEFSPLGNCVRHISMKELNHAAFSSDKPKDKWLWVKIMLSNNLDNERKSKTNSNSGYGKPFERV